MTETTIDPAGSHKVEKSRYASGELNKEQIITAIAMFGISQTDRLP